MKQGKFSQIRVKVGPRQTFLEGIGIVTTDEERLEEVLSSENAEMLSCALLHTQIDDPTLRDPYFTEEQWCIVQSRRHKLLDDAEELVDGFLASSAESPETRQKGKEWLDRKRATLLCACKVHKCEDADLYTDVLGVLVTI